MVNQEYSPNCPHCQTEREPTCLFAQIALYFANNPDLTPAEKQLAIAQARINARNRNCPHLNDINPSYAGMKNL
jgi:hypothetical protein